MTTTTTIRFDCGLDLSLAKQWDCELGMTTADVHRDFEWALNTALWFTPDALAVHLRKTLTTISESKSLEVARRLHTIRLWLNSIDPSPAVLNDFIVAILGIKSVAGVPPDILAAFVAALIPDDDFIAWMGQTARPDLAFVDHLPSTTEFDLTTGRNRYSARPPFSMERRSPPPPPPPADYRIEEVAGKCSEAWNKADTDLRRLFQLDLLLGEFIPGKTTTKRRSDPPNLTILERFFHGCRKADDCQHPSLFYWIVELGKLSRRMIAKMETSASQNGRIDALTAFLAVQRQIHILRLIGMQFAFTAMEAKIDNAANAFLCQLLNPNLPPI